LCQQIAGRDQKAHGKGESGAKYDEGRYESEVNVLVVRIGVDDVVEQGGQ
jgi:hypothetical protein